MRFHLRARGRRRSALVALVLSATTLTSCLPTDPPDRIELPAAYEVQSLCDPTAKPGTEALAAILRSRYSGTSTGIVRDCGVGGRSEHKEGRAIDWSGVSAFDSASRTRVDSTLRWLLDADDQGRRFALARRLGVMYIIWNKQIWIADDADLGWQPYPCSGVTLCHQDHVHLSLSQAGAAKQTSYWTGRTGEPAGLTVAWLDPRTGRLDLPVTVQPGHRYRITAHGAFITSTPSPSPRPMADANCSADTAYGWATKGVGISVDGSTAWTPATSSIPGCDLFTHTYTMVLTPTSAHQPVLRIVGDADLSDNSNQVSVTVHQLS